MTITLIILAAITGITTGITIGLLITRRAASPADTQRVAALETTLQQADQMLQQRGKMIVALAIKACGTRGKARIPPTVLEQAATQAVNFTPRPDGGYDLALVGKAGPQ